MKYCTSVYPLTFMMKHIMLLNKPAGDDGPILPPFIYSRNRGNFKIKKKKKKKYKDPPPLPPWGADLDQYGTRTTRSPNGPYDQV